MSLKHFLSLFILIVVAFFGPSLWAEELNVYFKTTPRQELLRPSADPIDLSLLITGPDGRPIKQGSVAVRFDAPPPGRFFSTDIPLVEGTLLSEMQLPLRQGRANWKQLFPIRGNYRLIVNVVASDGTQASKTFTFSVREHRLKWLALTAFSAGLFLLGFVAGRVFTGARGSAVLVVQAAAIFAGSIGICGAQQAGPAVLEMEPATVGRPSVVRWKLTGDGNVDVAPTAVLSLTITHLEKQKVVFAVEKIAVPGQWSVNFHFPDGAEYRVATLANVAGKGFVRNEQVMTVTGVEPPVTATVPVLSCFTALIAAGLGVGRWSKRRGATQP